MNAADKKFLEELKTDAINLLADAQLLQNKICDYRPTKIETKKMKRIIQGMTSASANDILSLGIFLSDCQIFEGEYELAKFLEDEIG